MNFSTEFFYQWTSWIGTIILSFILRIQDRKVMLKSIMILCRFWILNRVALVQLEIQWWVPTLLFSSGFLDFFWTRKIRSVRILDTIVCSGSWIGDIALAVLSALGRRQIHPASWLHLSFRGHWPYRLGKLCLPRPGAWPSSTYPRCRTPAFLPVVIKLVCVWIDSTDSDANPSWYIQIQGFSWIHAGYHGFWSFFMWEIMFKIMSEEYCEREKFIVNSWSLKKNSQLNS